MNRVEQAAQTTEKLGLPRKDLATEFPEFQQVKEQFLYGEVWAQEALSPRLRMLISIAALATAEGDDLPTMLRAALGQDVTPAELQEVFHQAAPYIGFPKAEKGLAVLKAVLVQAGITLPLAAQGTVTEETRLEEGIAAQKAIFGPMIDGMRAHTPEDQRFIQDSLSAFCFGDTYTRGALDLRTRELITFACLLSLGGCDSQVKSHVGGNLRVGNSRQMLVATVAACLPYVGFPRSLNALAAIQDVTKQQEEQK